MCRVDAGHSTLNPGLNPSGALGEKPKYVFIDIIINLSTVHIISYASTWRVRLGMLTLIFNWPSPPALGA